MVQPLKCDVILWLDLKRNKDTFRTGPALKALANLEVFCLAHLAAVQAD